MNNNRKAKLAALALIPTLGVAALAGISYAASDTTSTSVTGTTAQAQSRPFIDHGTHDNTQFATDLAQVLGLNTTDVKAKLDAGSKPSDIITAAGKTESDVMAQMKTLMETNMKNKLAADVAAGTITQAQANQMITNMANHTGGHDGGPGKDHDARDNTQFATDLAQVLGLSSTDVKAKLDAGSKPDDIITAAGKTATDVMTQLKTLRDAAMKTRLAADVLAGTITQAQADAMIARVANETASGHHGTFGKTPTTTSSTTSTQ